MKSIAVLLCAFLLTLSSHAANIVWVSFHPAEGTPSAAATTAGFTEAPDAPYTRLLTANGHTVTRVVSSDLPNAATLNAADLVIISRSVPSGHYELDPETAAWNGITAPTMILGGYILRANRLGYTSGTTIPDVATNAVKLKAMAPGHPIFNGISLDANGFMANTYATAVTFTNRVQRGISVNTSAITNGGVVLAVVGNLGDAATGGMIIGEWLPGALMNTNDIVGGRRLVFLTGSREHDGLTSEGAGIYDLAADGATMFLNAVNYMTSGRSSIRAVNTVNNETPGAGQTSLLQALSDLQDGDYISFNIPGAGPHVIATPIGGYPLITNNGITIDGYTQPGSVRNSNAILGGNNAQQRIVLDSTGTESAPNPDPALPGRLLRRSTRLDFPGVDGNTGYGDGENCIIGVYEGDNFAARGLSFIARHTTSDENDPSIYCIALVKQATNAHVSGCLFGMAPGGTTMAHVKPPAAAVAAFRWRVGGDVFSDGLTFGTDGDGINDRAEFNVALGARIALALELDGPKISGNYANVFPNGTTFVDIDAVYAQQVAIAGGGTVEFLENGRVAHNSVVGTDGDGISDADERNVIGHTVYDVHMEFYSAATNVVVAGNYVGVGIDGVTPAPRSTNEVQSFVALPGTASARIGSNGDGVSDDLEGNLILNASGPQLSTANATVPVVQRRNRFVNCNYTLLANDAALVPPTLNSITNSILSGTVPAAPSVEDIASFIDIYTADPAALANTNAWPTVLTHPSRWLATITDNGPGDLDLSPGSFAFSMSSMGVAESNYVTVTVTHSKEATASNAGLAVTTAPATPVAQRPSLSIQIDGPTVILSWIAPDETFVLQQNTSFDPNSWIEFFPHTHTGGRNINEIPKDNFERLTVYRLISQ
jgi:hypothetical protein